MLIVRSASYQPMVIGANSTPTGISNLGCSKEENFIQHKQLNSVIGHLGNSIAVRCP